jgi:polyhydroxyalkanoate synthesis regulator phasin
MIELLKKTILTGLGVASLTRDKIEQLGRELSDKGKMTEQEGQKFVEEMQKLAEESRASLQKQTEKVVESALAKMHLARAADMDELKQEIAALRAEIEAMRTEKE